MLSSQPPKRVPLGAIMGAASVLPDSLSTPMPQGLETSSSDLLSPSKSAITSNRLSAVLSSQPPNRVPLGAMKGDERVPPPSLSMPRPHGLDTGISAIASPSKSPFLAGIVPLREEKPPYSTSAGAVPDSIC